VKAVAEVSRKKAPAEKPAAAKAAKGQVPVIQHNFSEYIDITYPARAGKRQSEEAKKAPAKPARPVRKRSSTPAPETEEVPGIAREAETAVATAGPVRRMR
jgi:hypothetical protein